jgi:hypothetical protein
MYQLIPVVPIPGPLQLFLIPRVGLLPKFFSPGVWISTFSVMVDLTDFTGKDTEFVFKWLVDISRNG